MIRVGIIGASGYTGAELVRLLANHPGVELTLVTSRQYAGKPLAAVFPHLTGSTELVCEDPTGLKTAGRADVFFTAVPHQTAMAVVPELLASGAKVVDLSADFRLHQQQVYEQWYQTHSAPELLAEAVYGLPELHRAAIAQARLVANPGCYPTSVLLALAPLLKAGCLDPGSLIIDAKSGTSGAGRAAQTGTLYCEVTDGFKAYKVAEHRHTPEIEQELGKLCGQELTVSFTPHLVPMSRGMLSTIYATLAGDYGQGELETILRDYYREEPFVRVLPAGQLPATQYVRGSNFCDLALRVDRRNGRVIVLSAIDNLVKGAAGQAVQNLNLLCGLPEAQGLGIVPLFP
ncbi:N-acetyl-gamma-glutamyl-phosphate reductase [Desulfurivibrio alkaliphilus]|uniref:N-acetyl-gamma-glutamyl-phosphate reductase n=1 Tax=Desulfurivibrio alkaliphilus (strain DSM 19089 / UNIQEM U267 / AHT2) TaxID=589865 RepID=D6YZQ3_DESAT|nr:N-acetyl-gamma-glutamyl-phosphate reductase [Desulfurivibrio alkaliphilus]ADH85060.1 N-acetyl-gamma-glutamyl-phosphate reductase [Desulfurivibrio alkaliphilus AHT 2]